MNKLLQHIDILRIIEITGKTGFIFVGSFLAFPPLEAATILKFLHLYVLCIVLGIAIYAINSFFDYTSDLKNVRLNNLSKITKNEFKNVAIITTLLAIAVSLSFNTGILLIVVAMVIIWTVYVAPPFRLKTVPFMGIILAFIAQLLHFHLGFLLFDTFQLNSILFSIYFSILFAAGHALHEAIDYKADKDVGNTTTAVYLGQSKSYSLSLIFFALAAVYALLLYIFNLFSFLQALTLISAFVGQMVSWVIFKREIFKYRRLYMTYYFIAILCVVGLHYFN